MTNGYSAPAQRLIEATVAIAQQGVPLMHRVVDPTSQTNIWDHYPANDAIDHRNGYRWFYHAHPPGDRMNGEHGHFHIFAEQSCFAGKPVTKPLTHENSGADVVHLIALSIDMQGLPMQLFTVNRWVTDEWLYPADELSDALDHFALDSVPASDALVNAWLVAAVGFFRSEINALIATRDAVIASWADPASAFEDRTKEILSTAPVDLDSALEADLIGQDGASLLG